MVYKNAKDWPCPYCGIIIKSRKMLSQHLRECEEKKKLPVDSRGRTKIPGIAKKSAETLRRKVENGEAVYKRHKHTDEERQHLSNIRQKWLEENPNHGVKWYIINGIKVQGTWEKRFAEHLNTLGVTWTRVKIDFKRTHRYTPDFYCPNENVYFEIKGFRRYRDIYKMHLVLAEHPDLQIKMIEREQMNNLDKIDVFALPNFQDIYKLEDVDMSKFNDVWN